MREKIFLWKILGLVRKKKFIISAVRGDLFLKIPEYEPNYSSLLIFFFLRV